MNPFIQTKKNDKQTLLIISKIRNLITALQNANKAFKRIADRCHDRKAQILVFGIATESFQFYKELSLHAQILKGEANFNENIYTDYHYNDDCSEIEKDAKLDKVLEDCAYIEKGLISEFRKLLNDHLITGDLRKMLQEQLNGFLYAFAKIKMLSSLHVSSRNMVTMW